MYSEHILQQGYEYQEAALILSVHMHGGSNSLGIALSTAGVDTAEVLVWEGERVCMNKCETIRALNLYFLEITL